MIRSDSVISATLCVFTIANDTKHLVGGGGNKCFVLRCDLAGGCLSCALACVGWQELTHCHCQQLPVVMVAPVLLDQEPGHEINGIWIWRDMEI